MPTAKHHGTDADRDIYIGKLQSGGSKYDRPATENSEKQIQSREQTRKRLLAKLKARQEKQRYTQVKDE